MSKPEDYMQHWGSCEIDAYENEIQGRTVKPCTCGLEAARKEVVRLRLAEQFIEATLAQEVEPMGDDVIENLGNLEIDRVHALARYRAAKEARRG